MAKTVNNLSYYQPLTQKAFYIKIPKTYRQGCEKSLHNLI